MSPGIGLFKRRIEKADDAVSLAVSGIAKKYGCDPARIRTLETKYDADAGDWYVALGWDKKRAVVRMDSVQALIIDISEI